MRLRVAFIVVHAIAMTALPIGGAPMPQGSSGKKSITESVRKEFRVFVDQNGKTVKGRVLAYNIGKDTVTIEKENGQPHRADLNTFSKDDQDYVHEWHRIKQFLAPNLFHISTRKRQHAGGTELLTWKPEQSVVFDIMLENRSDHDLENLVIEYGIYCNSDIQAKTKSQDVKCGTLNIGTLDAGEKVQIGTHPIFFPTKDLFEYYKGKQIPKEMLQGIWLRIYLPLEGDRKAMREFSNPSTLMQNQKWITPDATSS